MKELEIEMIEDKSSKLLGDLNMENGLEIERIRKIEKNTSEIKNTKNQKQFMQLYNLLFQKKVYITFLDIKNIVITIRLKS